MGDSSGYRGKDVLLIAPVFFNYHIAIKKEIESKGGRVVFYSEKPQGLANHFVRFLSPRAKAAQYERYRQSVLDSIARSGRKFDIVLSIRSEAFTAEFYATLRRMMPDAYFVMYQWDSIRYIDYSSLIERFDRVFTFDYEDVSADPRLGLLPLFFIDDYAKPREATASSYDCLFFGSVNADRQEVLERLESELSRKGLSYKFYLYFPPTTFIRLLLSRKITAPLRHIGLISLSSKKIHSMLQRTKYVIDINTRGQSGLTMRTFESLAAGKIVITTNPNIAKEAILAENYCVFDRDEPVLDALSPGYREDPKFMASYSLGAWLENLLDGDRS